MAHKRRYLYILLVALILGIAGCTDGKGERDILKVGMECNSAPFNWTQIEASEFTEPLPDGISYCDGYDVQIAREIADSLDMDLEIRNYAVFQALLEGIKSGDIDLIIAGMTNTEERRQEIDFSAVYYRVDAVVVTRSESSFASAHTLDALKGAQISAQIGTVHDTIIDQIAGVKHGFPLESIPFLTTAVKQNAIDGFITEKPIALAVTASNPELSYVVFDPGQGFVMSDEDSTVSIGVAKTNPDLLNAVNHYLEGLSEENREEKMAAAIARQPSNTTDNTQMMPQGFINGIGFIVVNYWPMILKGIGTTLLIAVLGTVIGLMLGLVVAGLRQIRIKPNENHMNRVVKKTIKAIATSYVQYLRGTPMMVQGIIIYYGLHGMGIMVDSLLAAVVIVSLNTSAYISESIRAGIQAIDPGQEEAARSLGMSDIQTLRYIILPQALRNAIPSIGNEFINNLKDSSVLNVIAVSELFFQANRITGIYYRQTEPFFIVSLIYLIMTLISSAALKCLEDKMDISTRQNTR